MPKFSVIVPVYNVEEYLDECVKSVINQTFNDWELILVDDGSKDNSYKICCEYAQRDSRIIAVHQENGGASKARNNGLENASGEYIMFLDSDDFYNDENAFQTFDDNLNGVDALIFGCTDFNTVTGEAVVSRTGYDLELIGKNDYAQTMHYLLSSKLIPGGPTVFVFKREIAINNNIRFMQGIQDEDYDFVLSIFTNCRSISAIDNPFYSYRKGRTESVTGSANIKMIYGIDYTVKKWIPLCEGIDDPVMKKDILNYIAFIYSTGFVICGRMDRPTRKEALSIMKRHTSVLSFSYWKKPKITKYAIRLVGLNLFSIMAAKYFDRTHI
ncbi:MAG: glycosyltransferase family 2 protein [Eubacterium sp.]